MADVDPWWHRAAIYQVYPRSFRDANGDGTGDLPGVISELGYLASLGIDAIWLSPFYESPQRDSGYDVVDPRSVDPRYGTLGDAQALIDQAHDRGLRVLVDVVPNHVSSDHAWFRAALRSQPGSPERARFHFRDGRGPSGDEPPTNWISMFGGPAWSREIKADGSAGQWYLHLFDSSQPDLNWENGQVRADGLATLRFWLDMGVDGFRVDVALGLRKDMSYPDLDDPEGLVLALRMDLDDGTPQARERRSRVANSPILDRDEVQEIYREWRSMLDSYPGNRMAVAEAWVPTQRAIRYVAQDTLHQIFNFDFMAVAFDARAIAEVIGRTLDGFAGLAPPTWALSNHDSPRVVTRLGGGEGGCRRARALALIAHCLPGSVYVYQGEELGLEDVELAAADRQDPVWFRTKGAQLGRDGARVPLPWSGDEPAYGFSDRPTGRTWLPQPAGWGALTVAAQSQDPGSTLEQYRAMLGLRHVHPGLTDNSQITVSVASPGVLVIERGHGFACVVNTTHDLVTSPIRGRILVASDGQVEGLDLPPGTGAWLQS
jgi:alpha-glucosidase